MPYLVSKNSKAKFEVYNKTVIRKNASFLDVTPSSGTCLPTFHRILLPHFHGRCWWCRQ
jgi:hypothetical protein